MKKSIICSGLVAVLLLSGCANSAHTSGGFSSEQSADLTQTTSSQTSSSADSSVEVSNTEASSEVCSSVDTEPETSMPGGEVTDEAPVFASNTMPEDYSTEPVEFHKEYVLFKVWKTDRR